MNGMSHRAIGNPGLPLAILLSLSMMGGAWAAGAPATTSVSAAAQPAEQLEELDEIWVRGKSLSQEIRETEDAFFAVYNKVNRNESFRITCGEMSLHPGSMIMRRACVPSFAAIAYRGSYPTTVYSSCNASGRSRDQNGVLMSLTSTSCGGGTWSVMNTGMGQPSMQALVAARSKELAVHLMMVINSDARLQEMAGQLDDLYLEFNTTRVRYSQMRPAESQAKPRRVNTGPRAM